MSETGDSCGPASETLHLKDAPVNRIPYGHAVGVWELLR